MKTYKQFLEACWKGYKQVGMKDKNGKKVPNCVPENNEDMSLAPKGKGREGAKKLYKEDEVDEVVTPAQRMARKQAYLKKTMAKYGQAAKMGIPASQVNQRRNAVTRKKT